MFDTTRIHAELDHIQRALNTVTAPPSGTPVLASLRRDLDRPRLTLTRFALIADCVRLAAAGVCDGLTIRESQLAVTSDFFAMVARQYAAMVPAYRELAGATASGARTFLYRYMADTGQFGQRSSRPWPGLELCREAESLRYPEARQRYSRLMAWLLSEAKQLMGKSRPRFDTTIDTIATLRDLLGAPTAPAPDPERQISAFLTQTRIFADVQYASTVHEPDPFDSDEIYATARRAFARVLQQAATPTPASTGNTLLLIGDSGTGKTHLLRAFYQQVHEHGCGFAAYVPLHTQSSDYARHMLHHVIESLTRTYAGAVTGHSGLSELATGMIRLAPEPIQHQLLQLTEGKWRVSEGADTFAQYVHGLADQLQRYTPLATLERDLVRVMVFALYPVAGMISRVTRYLRCVDLSREDRDWLGDIVPSTDTDAPTRMIRDLARLAFLTRGAPFVIMVDQAERAVEDPVATGFAFSRVVEVLSGLVSETPHLVAVMSYVENVYELIRPKLTKSVLDRIEVSPPPIRLRSGSTSAEIEAMLSRRLAWLYAEAEVVYRPEAPLYPLPEHLTRELVGQRPRDVIGWCNRFQEQCAAEGRIIDDLTIGTDSSGPPRPDLQISAAWAQALGVGDIEFPEDEDEILEIIAHAAATCAEELGIVSEHVYASTNNLSAIKISLHQRQKRSDLVIGWAQNGPQAGSFRGQLTTLRKLAKNSEPVAARRGSFPNGTASQGAINTLCNAGGRVVSLDDPTLRAMIVARGFKPVASPASVLAWRRQTRPMSSIAALADLFGLAQWTTNATSQADDRSAAHGEASDLGDPAMPGRRKARAAS